MPRSGPNGTYTLPPVYLAVPGTTIIVDQHNVPLEDIATTFNTATPISYGGTGQATAAAALTALGAEAAPNIALLASVGGSALTIALKGANGADPSTTNPVVITFRNVTATLGTPSVLTITTAISLVVSSGSTLGMTSAVAATLAIVAFNDAGTLRLGIVNTLVRPLLDGIASSTAEGGAGGADSAGVIYSGTAVSSKAMTVIGYAIATEATAGTWATAPATLAIADGPEFNDVVPQVTPWVAYTPIYTSFGTVTGSNMFSRRVGDTAEFEGVFTVGTGAASECRMSLGFNGTEGNITADATKVASIRVAGVAILNASGAVGVYPLIESNVAYITFGIQAAGTAALTKAQGTGFTGTTISLQASIPITGW